MSSRKLVLRAQCGQLPGERACTDYDCPVSCPGDLNGDGIVQVDDLLLLIGSWGAYP